MKLTPPGPRGWTIAAIGAVVMLALPYLLGAEHHGGWWESIPGWWAWFGGLGAVLFVLVRQALAKILQKPEDWYD